MPLSLFFGLLLSDRIQLACWSLILIYRLSFFAPSNKQADVKQVRPVHSISVSQSALTVQHPHASHTPSGYVHTMNHQPAPICQYPLFPPALNLICCLWFSRRGGGFFFFLDLQTRAPSAGWGDASEILITRSNDSSVTWEDFVGWMRIFSKSLSIYIHWLKKKIQRIKGSKASVWSKVQQ